MRQSDSIQVREAVKHIEPSVVFSNSTIHTLATHLSLLVLSSQHPSSHSDVAAMQEMVDRYTVSLPSRFSLPVPQSPPSTKQTVLLTGSTGSLGSNLLAQLLADERVERVWAVNRHSKDKTIVERQKESFIDKDLDVKLLDLDGTKLMYVEAELSEDYLGLDKSLYDQVCISTRDTICSVSQSNILPIDCFLDHAYHPQCMASRLQLVSRFL